MTYHTHIKTPPTVSLVPDTTLDERLAFERLLADLSARFANVPGDRLEIEIEDVLGRILDFLGFDRSTVFEFGDAGSIVVLCSTALNGVQAIPRGALTYHCHGISANFAREESSLLIAFGASSRRFRAQYMRRIGMRSNLSLPLRVGGEVIVYRFGAFREARTWPDLIVRLKLMGEVFAQALARKRADEERWPRWTRSSG